MKKKLIIIEIILTLVVLYSFAMIHADKYEAQAKKTEYEPQNEVTEDSYITLNEVTGLTLVESHMTSEEMKEEKYFDSLETLAICVEAEAGNQDLYGKRLVVDVILNRVDFYRFPDDIESVITQKYQFSTYWNGAMQEIQEPSDETYEAVRMELEQRTDNKILFFTAGGYNTYCTPAYKYGDHYFGY